MALAFKASPYPVVLTDKDWQKHKGNIAKLAGKTGVGELMKKAETAYKAVKWNDIELFKFLPHASQQTKDTAEKVFQDVMKARGKELRDLELAVSAVQKKATDTAAAWKNNKLIPADSVKHVQSVATLADNFRNATAVGAVSVFLNEQKKKAEADFATVKAILAKGLETLKKYVNGFAAAAKSTTLVKYNSLWSEHIRGVGTQLAPLANSNPLFKSEYEVWRKFSNKEVTPPNEDEFKKQIAILLKVIEILKPKLDKLA